MSGTTNRTIYSGTPCNLCGGDTYLMSSGSIWCPDSVHGGNGHFVIRVAFERAPKSEAAAREAITSEPKVRSRAKPAAPKPTFSLGYDDFVKGDR